MVSYCFLAKFVKWIMNCVRNTSYSLLLNGRIQGSFKGEQGLSQGDPISPLLFVPIMEYLCRRIQQASREKDFQYHPLCKKMKLTNLCFADDLVIFCKGNDGSLSAIKVMLDEFSKNSGLSINFAKSQVYFGGVSLPIPLAQKINLSTGGEKFNVSRLYRSVLLQDEFSAAGEIWSRLNVPKHAFQLWQAAQSKLLKRDMLCRLYIPIPNNNCVVCDIETESHHHIFFGCIFSKQVLSLLFN
uniref:Reverse transcriptase domain-containing protein n=1 Tax=Cannabis sativa TaxID=3483 RepID=A0A803PKK3_CANSA